MFNKVIIVAEISFNEEELVKKARQLKELGVQECLLIQCVTSYEEMSLVSFHFSDFLKENLDRQIKILMEVGLVVKSKRLIDGDIVKQINKIGASEGYELIVVGSARHTMVGEFLFGGVSYDVIHKTNLPVFVIRTTGEAQRDDKPGEYTRHILFPTDFSDNANLAFEKLKELTKCDVEKITLVHVIKQSWLEEYLSKPVDDFKALALEKLEELKQELCQFNVPNIEVKVAYGSPTQELLKIIDEENVTMVIMGSQGRGFVKEIYLGSVSHHLSRTSSCPVLLIPAKRD